MVSAFPQSPGLKCYGLGQALTLPTSGGPEPPQLRHRLWCKMDVYSGANYPAFLSLSFLGSKWKQQENVLWKTATNIKYGNRCTKSSINGSCHQCDYQANDVLEPPCVLVSLLDCISASETFPVKHPGGISSECIFWRPPGRVTQKGRSQLQTLLHFQFTYFICYIFSYILNSTS